jgi:hypothetical protein
MSLIKGFFGEGDNPTQKVDFCSIIKIFDLRLILSVLVLVKVFFVAPAKKTISFL